MGLNPIRTALRFSLILVLILSYSLSAWDEPVLMSFGPITLQDDGSEYAPERVCKTQLSHPQISSIRFEHLASGACLHQITALLTRMCTPAFSSELRL
jgi:hypothetical protein